MSVSVSVSVDDVEERESENTRKTHTQQHNSFRNLHQPVSFLLLLRFFLGFFFFFFFFFSFSCFVLLRCCLFGLRSSLTPPLVGFSSALFLECWAPCGVSE